MCRLSQQILMSDPVLVLSTGGTIASTAGSEGATPTESGEELVDAIPDLRERVRVEEVARRPSPDVDFSLLARLRRRIDTHACDGDTGVVITHGTDTMAESAYYLDLIRDGDPPVVVTGAQRRPDQPGADGPANLAAAVSAAEELALQSAGGAYVCFNGELHTARDAVKTHTWRPDAFASPATIGPDGFRRYRELGSRSETLPDVAEPAGDVPIVTTGIGVGRSVVDRAVQAGCGGLVIRATGLGNTPEPVAKAVDVATTAGVSVVVTSRCHAGAVAPVYGNGGGQTLRDNGAIFAGDLPATKARIKLLPALVASVDVEEAFADR